MKHCDRFLGLLCCMSKMFSPCSCTVRHVMSTMSLLRHIRTHAGQPGGPRYDSTLVEGKCFLGGLDLRSNEDSVRAYCSKW